MFSLNEQREWNGLLFDLEWLNNHIPTIDRLIKIDDKYEIKECPHCIKFYKDLKNG
jgi:hypothetical protein